MLNKYSFTGNRFIFPNYTVCSSFIRLGDTTECGVYLFVGEINIKQIT